MAVVGWLRSAPFVGAEQHVAAFRQGLSDKGFIEGQNVTVEYRSAEGHHGRLASLATELVQRKVNAIFCDNIAALAAKEATASIPIVFAGGGDAVKEGLVASLNRPGGNVTGVNFFTGAIGTKRLALLHQIAPNATKIAVLLQPNTPQTDAERQELEAAAESTGQPLLVMQVNDVQEIESAITALVERGAGALLVGSGPFLYSNRNIIIELASRHALPSSYTARQAAEDGGLISYGTDLTDALRQGGNYVGRVLNGEKAADLPVMRSTKFELVINLKTAKALGLQISPDVLALADEVIE
ncbi:ABC transporter substrate-binding protein [Bradyrhizobium sp. DASA03005]|uniref:ABC transporter substrate-binding protein n=1 Tax=Bradyrhizobium sp. SPXBL-02 TaxID=3395912 RepID=UPI003F707FDF